METSATVFMIVATKINAVLKASSNFCSIKKKNIVNSSVFLILFTTSLKAAFVVFINSVQTVDLV